MEKACVLMGLTAVLMLILALMVTLRGKHMHTMLYTQAAIVKEHFRSRHARTVVPVGYRVQMTIDSEGINDTENRAYDDMRAELLKQNVDVGLYTVDTPEGKDVVSRFSPKYFPDLRILKGDTTIAVYQPWVGSKLVEWAASEASKHAKTVPAVAQTASAPTHPPATAAVTAPPTAPSTAPAADDAEATPTV